MVRPGPGREAGVTLTLSCKHGPHDKTSTGLSYFTDVLYIKFLIPEMCDSPENIQQLELELERASLKKDSGPDQENNVRDMKKFLENNNDAMAANFEEKHHCDLDDGMIIHHPVKMMINNIERKPPEKVYFDHHDHHEVLRGIGFKNQPVLTFLD